MSILYITHDLGVIARMVQVVAVMYLGRIVEFSDVDSLFYDSETSLHFSPYSNRFRKSARNHATRLESVRGAVPVPINRPAGCGFYPRCFRRD